MLPPDPHREGGRYAVVIVGAGPTGLTLANLLGCYGISTLLIERNASTVSEPRAVSIDDESLRTMQAAGIVEEVIAQTVPGYGSHYHAPSGRCFAKVHPTEMPFGYPRRNAFRQPVLERQLRAALGRFDGVQAWFGHAFVAATQDENGVSVQVKRDVQADIEVRCDYLVGCDGASSAVRRLLGVELRGSTFDERWLIVDLEDSPSASPHTKVFCNNARPCIALPGPDRTRRYEFKLHPHERDEQFLAPGVVEALLATHEAHSQSRVVRKTVYRFHARIAERWSQGRIFLAGDAAHLTPPFAGQGMNSGVRDAHNLAWKLAAAIRGQCGTSVLATYEVERRDHAAAMIRLALRMGSVMAPRSAAAGVLIRGIFNIARLCPPVHDYISQMKYKPKPRFQRGILLRGMEGCSNRLVGRLLPQPLVECSAGRRFLLDEAMGDRFTLLVRNAEPLALLGRMTHSIWLQIEARRVAVLTVGAQWCSATGITVVRELSPLLGDELAACRQCVLVVRPDRYVAACIPAHDVESASAAMAALINGPGGAA